MSEYFLGVDAGGSHTRAALISDQGELLGLGFSGAANFRTKPFAQAALAIQDSVAQALTAKAIKKVQAVCIGSAGLEEQGTEEEGRKLLGNVIRAETVLLDTDAYIAWAGALKAQPGVMVISGTGSICLGIDTARLRHRIGGWGPYFGDEGSAHAIANKAIREALKVIDGRSHNTAFLQALLSFAKFPTHWDQSTAHTLTSWLYAKERSSSELAGFALLIDQLAQQGNVCAQDLLKEAAESLAGLVPALMSKGSFQFPVLVSIGGSVLKYSSIAKKTFLHSLPESCIFSEPALPPVLGAAVLAWLATNPFSTPMLDTLLKTAANHPKLG